MEDDFLKRPEALPRASIAICREVEEAKDGFDTTGAKVGHIVLERLRLPVGVPDEKPVSVEVGFAFQREETLAHHGSVDRVEDDPDRAAGFPAELLGGSVGGVAQGPGGLEDAFPRGGRDSDVIASRAEQDAGRG